LTSIKSRIRAKKDMQRERERGEAITGKTRERMHIHNKKTFILITIHKKNIYMQDLGIIYET
jgi:hypothetical protein